MQLSPFPSTAALAVLLLSFTTSLHASPFPGSYTTTKPSTITDPPKPSITVNISGPVLTTDWCASLAFSDTSENMFAHPLVFRCTRSGLELGYPNQTAVEADYYATPFNRDIRVTVDGLKPGSALMDWYGDWAVRASWDDGMMKATMAHGSPFVYFDVADEVSLSFLAKPVVWHDEGGALGITVGNRHYGLFAPAGSSWNTASSTFASTLSGKNYFSLAAIPDTAAATLRFFKRFAFNAITDTRVTWKYDCSAAIVTTLYQASFTSQEGTEPGMLFALYPHQWHYYRGTLTNYTYNSVNGTMKVIEAASFTTIQPYTGILPHLPLMAKDGADGFKRSTLEGFISTEAAKNDNTLIRTDGDTYWTGKDFGRTAQLVRIADQLGNAAARDRFLDVIKQRLEDWLVFDAGETAECFYYNKAWGTLIGANPSYDSDKSLNDHHFHYGYFIYAAATAAQFDRAWALKWKPMIDLLIRDCNSPLRDDDLFPFMRSFDLYAGHSWASGNALFSSGNNQESSSEAINFAAGTALWGMAIGDTLFRDLGIFLYTTEKNAILDYWFDIKGTVFPSTFNHAMVGIVWGEKAAYETWFSSQAECVHGINMLPMTAASLYLGISPAYVIANFAEIEKNNGGPINEWYDILWEYLALGDGADAVKRLSAGSNYTPENGESKAHTYHWVHNIAAAGTVDTGITADAPSYAVFNNGAVRTYVVWNPGEKERLVSFSDRRACTVPAATLAAFGEAEMASTFPCGKVAFETRKIEVRKVPGGYRIILPEGTAAPGNVRFFNCTGRLVRAFDIRWTDGTVPLCFISDRSTKWAKGVYLIKINEANGSIAGRWVVR